MQNYLEYNKDSPFLSNNVPSAISYSVYISQPIKYIRWCTYYDDFGHRHKRLVNILLSHDYRVNQLRNFFQKFYYRYPDLITKYRWLARDMLNDLLPHNTFTL